MRTFYKILSYILSASVYIIQLLLSWFGFYLQYCISYYYL